MTASVKFPFFLLLFFLLVGWLCRAKPSLRGLSPKSQMHTGQGSAGWIKAWNSPQNQRSPVQCKCPALLYSRPSLIPCFIPVCILFPALFPSLFYFLLYFHTFLLYSHPYITSWFVSILLSCFIPVFILFPFFFPIFILFLALFLFLFFFLVYSHSYFLVCFHPSFLLCSHLCCISCFIPILNFIPGLFPSLFYSLVIPTFILFPDLFPPLFYFPVYSRPYFIPWFCTISDQLLPWWWFCVCK